MLFDVKCYIFSRINVSLPSFYSTNMIRFGWVDVGVRVCVCVGVTLCDNLRNNEMISRCSRSGSQKETSHSRPQQPQQHVGNHLPGGS